MFLAGPFLRGGVSSLALTLAVTAAAAVPACAQTGAHDAPYSFLRDQTDQIAVSGFEAGTGSLPTSDLFTGYTEFGVRVGATKRAFPAQGRRLEGGRYPVLTSFLVDGDIAYTFKTFAANVGPSEVNFLHVEAVNLSFKPRTAHFTASVRWNGGRFVHRGGDSCANTASRGPSRRRGRGSTPSPVSPSTRWRSVRLRGQHGHDQRAGALHLRAGAARLDAARDGAPRDRAGDARDGVWADRLQSAARRRRARGARLPHAGRSAAGVRRGDPRHRAGERRGRREPRGGLWRGLYRGWPRSTCPSRRPVDAFYASSDAHAPGPLPDT